MNTHTHSSAAATQGWLEYIGQRLGALLLKNTIFNTAAVSLIASIGACNGNSRVLGLVVVIVAIILLFLVADFS